MRKGVTIEEVEAFAGKGKVMNDIGRGENRMTIVTWEYGRKGVSVTFRAGRAHQWLGLIRGE